MQKDNDFWKIQLRESSILNPPDRISEILFGLIMVLTFTCTISVSNSGKQEVRELLWAALGCNLAWGIVDAIMYLMDIIIFRAHSIKQISWLKKTENKSEIRTLVRDNISPFISELMEDDEIDRLGEKIKGLPQISVRKVLILRDFLAAGQIFLLVSITTLPVALPFIFINDVGLSMRISNGVAIVLLFSGGYSLARYSGLRPVITALIYTGIGVLLVGMTMLMGG